MFTYCLVKTSSIKTETEAIALNFKTKAMAKTFKFKTKAVKNLPKAVSSQGTASRHHITKIIKVIIYKHDDMSRCSNVCNNGSAKLQSFPL